MTRSAGTAHPPSPDQPPGLLGGDGPRAISRGARWFASRPSAAPHAASCSKPNEDLRASLCDRLAASSRWHTSLPVRQHLPRHMYTAPLMPYPDSSSLLRDPSLCSLSRLARSTDGDAM
eukprot:8411055-Pyramimonas_sp.AAC.1